MRNILKCVIARTFETWAYGVGEISGKAYEAHISYL
jgi:hypothetical protein